MKLKPGYKQTEVGVIPEDWEVKHLGEVGESLIGLTYRPADVRSDGILVLRSSNIQQGALRFDDNVFVKVEVPERIIVKSGDILICVRNGSRDLIGKCIQIDERAQGMTFGAFMAVFRTSCHNFVHHLFQSQLIKGQIQEHLGATINQITNKSLNSFQIPLPPAKVEQEAIAEVLSNANALVDSLEQIVAKKRVVKQGAIHELFTPKDGWSKVKLGSLGKFLKGSGIKKDECQSGNLPCVRYGEIYTKHDNYIKTFYSWISPEVAANATQLKAGDILFAGSGETKAEIGKCVTFLGNMETYSGGDIVILRPDNANSMFLGYYLNTPPVKFQKSSRGQGDAVVHIGSAALADIDLMIPTLAEQAAIATILEDMDSEITGLEAKLAKARQIKQGMMQELLTGRIRLAPSTSKTITFPKTKESDTPATTAHNWQINEAVVIAVLAKTFGSEQYPLARVRCTKLTYLLHRHVEHKAEGYLKKAAGPYNPATKYKGPEGIAQKNKYTRPHHNGTYSGFVAAENIAQAEAYFQQWYGADVLAWLKQFRYKKTEELELLATVDMAAEDLRRDEKTAELASVKQIIRNHPEWKAKLERPIFSDANIAQAILICQKLFA